MHYFPQQRKPWGFSIFFSLALWTGPGRVRSGSAPWCPRGVPVVLAATALDRGPAGSVALWPRGAPVVLPAGALVLARPRVLATKRREQRTRWGFSIIFPPQQRRAGVFDDFSSWYAGPGPGRVRVVLVQ